MDELLRHCLQELAFEGDLGCDVSRLRDFVAEFYISRNSMQQNLDDSYYAFVWSLVTRQPSVQVGVLPDGQTADVYIPPQPRASKKGKGPQDNVEKVEQRSTKLDLIPNASRRYTLHELLQSYGNRLRISVDPETCFVAVTGSHAKPGKLTPMVYAALQIIARSRESGISVLDLGKTTGYDQKTCFYLVKQLLDLNIIVKLRRGGNSQNFCVLKYFFDRNPMWKNIREEELRVQEELMETIRGDDETTEGTAGSFQLPQFDTIDTRHLTSLNILRQRLVKLLKHSRDETQPYTNISVKIGFYPRSRTERRFFIVRLNELINEGAIEKFYMPSSNPDTAQNRQLYLRLTSSPRVRQLVPAVNSVKLTDDDEDMIDNLVTEDKVELLQVISNVTLHKQVVDLLQEASSSGATLNELCDRLGSFDKKTLELTISRMERQAPPAHLADLSIIQVLETHGRERRHRFFTLGGYSELVTREGFEQPSGQYSFEDLPKAGGFEEDRKSDFYEKSDDLQAFYKKWSGPRHRRLKVSTAEENGKSPREARTAAFQIDIKTSRATPKKFTNPILPDGTRKRGRPPKQSLGTEKQVQKRARNAVHADTAPIEARDGTIPIDTVVSTSRMHEGTKRKRDGKELEGAESETVGVPEEANLTGNVPLAIPKRKRGRPPKKRRIDTTEPISSTSCATHLEDKATGQVLEATSAEVNGSSSTAKRQYFEPPESTIISSATVSTTVVPSIRPSDLQVSAPVSKQTNGDTSVVSIPSRHSPSVSNMRAPQQKSSSPAARECFDETNTASQECSFQDRTSQTSPLLTLAVSSVSGDGSQSRSAVLLDTLPGLQEDSLQGMHQAEATRVIASLAAQVNESFSSCLTTNSTKEGATAACAQLSDSTVRGTIQNGGIPENALVGEDSANIFKMGESVEDLEPPRAHQEAPRHSNNISTVGSPEIAEDSNKLSTPIGKPTESRPGHHERKNNLSAMRRENELIQLIETAGGILNTSTAEFFSSHMDLIAATVKAGEAASAPVGARLDRRTLTYTLNKLEAIGRIKTVITHIPSVTGGYRNAKVAYLPTLPDERLREYLAAQGLAEKTVLRRQKEARQRIEEIESDPNSPVMRKLEKKRQREAREGSAKREADMKVLLVHKRLEAIRNRESAWDDIVEKVHPGLVKGVAETRLRKLRQSYIQGNVVQDSQHWEFQISDAIKAAEKMRSTRSLFPNASRSSRRNAEQEQPEINLSHVPSAAQGKSVESLIKLQENLTVEEGEANDTDAPISKKKAGARKTKGNDRIRRQRFHWTADYDELARDAYAIVRARCRAHYRLEWAAFDQVFTSVPKNSVRARIAVLKDQAGAAAYLQRLENCWYDIWVKKRGTPELPDPNPRSTSEFDLKAHLEYLRKFVDKNAMRCTYISRVGVLTLEDTEHLPLPAEMEELISSWKLEERKASHASWDFLSNTAIGEETREKVFLEGAFVLERDGIFSDDTHSDVACLAESALKMVVGTPDDSYNAHDAAKLLHGVGEDEISAAMDNLLSRNVLSKLVRDPTRLVPGRTVKISEINLNALGGPVSKDIFVDATQFEESYEMEAEQWREWPLTSSDGDTAALLQRFSDHQVEVDIDTSHAQKTRVSIDGNSRKVDDDDIELNVQVKLTGATMPETQVPSLDVDEQVPMELDDAPAHGTTIFGDQACCNICSDGVVDCLNCVEEACVQTADWLESDRSIVNIVIEIADGRMKHGISIEELRASMETVNVSLAGAIHRLHTLRVPLLYLVGYNSSIVVSAKYAGAWAVTLPGEGVPLSRIFPRRWLDLTGSRVMTIWEAGLRAIVGLIHLKPGISQAELRWRLRAVYDRQEILELLNHLMSSGVLKVVDYGAGQPEEIECIDALSREQEKKVFWEVREDERWYRIS